jgi:diaminopimelate epimerase
LFEKKINLKQLKGSMSENQLITLDEINKDSSKLSQNGNGSAVVTHFLHNYK